MKKPILISGIQPTGKLHLGNYLGSLRNFVELQNSGNYDCYFFIADYHSLTADFDPKEKMEQILGIARAYLAAGVSPKKSTIFLQSAVPAVTELAWILTTLTPLGELERMTQFKDKSDQHESVNAGLLTYPVLMAADILLFSGQHVPVGDDQLQHLELTRTLARKFNGRFGETFAEPQAILTKTPRIMSLDEPERKMSKSMPGGCLFLNDSPEEIRAKISRAVTDSGNEIKHDSQEKPGITNLLEIYEVLAGKPINEIETMYQGKGYGQFKTDLAAIIEKTLIPFRLPLYKDSELKRFLAAGDKKAQKLAAANIKAVKKKIGVAI